MVEIPLEQMVTTADAVVRGVVLRTGTRVYLGDSGLEPRTHTWIQVTDWLAGRSEKRVVEIWEPGGSYGETTVETIGTPRYHRGEEVVVFLRRDETRPELFRTHQMAQGKYRVLPVDGSGRRRVARDLDEVAFASWRAGAFEVRPAPPNDGAVALEDLLADIRRTASRLERRARRAAGTGGAP